MYDKTQASLSDLMESSIEMNQKLRNKESILGKRKYSSISGGNEILNQVIFTHSNRIIFQRGYF